MDTIIAFYAAGGWTLFCIVMGAFLVAGMVKGVIGLGLPTVGVGLLSLAMPPTQAAALIVVPAMLTNIWQMAAGGRFLQLLRRLGSLLAGIATGSWLGAWLWSDGAGSWAGHILGVALLFYSVIGLFSPALRMSPRQERLLGPWVGAATGLLTATTGVFVIPLVPYMQAMALERDELVQAMGIAFMVSAITLAGGLAWSGAFGGREAQVSLLALLPAGAGMIAGQWLRHRVTAKTFKRTFFLALAALGLHQAISG